MRKRLLASVAATALLAGVVTASAQRGPESGERSPAASSQSKPSSGSERSGGSAGSQSQQQDRGGMKSGQSAPSPRSTSGAGSTEDRKGDRLDRGSSGQSGSSQIEKRQPQGAQQQDRSKGQTPAASQERKGTTGAAQGERSNQQGERSKQEPRSGASQRSNERSTTGQSRSREETDRIDRRDDRMNGDRNTRDRDTSRAREESSPTGRSDREDRTGARQDRSSTSVRLSTEQRGRIADVISRQNVRSETSVNINVSVGARVPRSVRLSTLPRDVVSIYPQFRGYRYTVVRDEIVIIDPDRYEIVEVIPRSGGGRATTGRAPSSDRSSTRISLAPEKRRIIREQIVREQSVPRCEDMQVTVGTQVSTGIRFSPFPELIVREVPEVREYSYCMHDQDVVLIDPDDRRIVEVID